MVLVCGQYSFCHDLKLVDDGPTSNFRQSFLGLHEVFFLKANINRLATRIQMAAIGVVLQDKACKVMGERGHVPLNWAEMTK